MKKKTAVTLIISLLILVVVAMFTGRVFLPVVLKSAALNILSSRLGAKVDIADVKIISSRHIQFSDIRLSKKAAYDVSIKQADLESISFMTFFKGTPLNCDFRDFKMSQTGSALINGIASLLSMRPVDVLNFKDITFQLISKDNQLIFKGLDARGNIIKVLANGTIGKKNQINYNLKLLLSKELTDQIPEKVREVFFKEAAGWSQIDLYVSGTNKKPFINLSTGLFKLILR